MKKVMFFLTSLLVFSGTAYAKNLLESYYAGDMLSVEAALLQYDRAKTAYKNVPDDNNLCVYIDSCTMLSTLYSSGMLAKYQALIEGLHQETSVLAQDSVCPEVLMSYADFLYSEFAWKQDTAEIILKLPILYRKIIRISGKHSEAEIKLAIWYISASEYDTANWNSFIKRQEHKLESLDYTDLFLAYLNYSMFYMRNYESRKGYEYLEKAKKLYPNNVLCSLIESNYAAGKTGW